MHELFSNYPFPPIGWHTPWIWTKLVLKQQVFVPRFSEEFNQIREMCFSTYRKKGITIRDHAIKPHLESQPPTVHTSAVWVQIGADTTVCLLWPSDNPRVIS